MTVRSLKLRPSSRGPAIPPEKVNKWPPAFNLHTVPMTSAVIVDAVRTAIGKRGGALKEVRPDDLAAHVLRAIVERNDLKPSLVDDVILGSVTQIDEQGMKIAGMPALAAGFPAPLLGGAVEAMSRVPISSDAGVLNEKLVAKYDVVPQGIAADLVADKYEITREQMDEFSYWSHRKAVKAIDDGRFKAEIIPVPVIDEQGTKRTFDTDEHPRRNTSLEKLAALPPAFRVDGRITAGNSSGINDGAAALLVTTDAKAKEMGWTPRARILATSQVGVDPVLMLEGPIDRKSSRLNSSH